MYVVEKEEGCWVCWFGAPFKREKKGKHNLKFTPGFSNRRKMERGEMMRKYNINTTLNLLNRKQLTPILFFCCCSLSLNERNRNTGLEFPIHRESLKFFIENICLPFTLFRIPHVKYKVKNTWAKFLLWANAIRSRFFPCYLNTILLDPLGAQSINLCAVDGERNFFRFYSGKSTSNRCLTSLTSKKLVFFSFFGDIFAE